MRFPFVWWCYDVVLMSFPSSLVVVEMFLALAVVVVVAVLEHIFFCVGAPSNVVHQADVAGCVGMYPWAWKTTIAQDHMLFHPIDTTPTPGYMNIYIGIGICIYLGNMECIMGLSLTSNTTWPT